MSSGPLPGGPDDSEPAATTVELRAEQLLVLGKKICSNGGLRSLQSTVSG